MSDKLERQLADLEGGDHLCLIYTGEEERLAASVPFLHGGIRRRHRCVVRCDADAGRSLRRALDAAGVDAARAEEDGLLAFIQDARTFRDGDRFEIEKAIEPLRRGARRVSKNEFDGFRVCGDVPWVMGGDLDADALRVHEVRLQELSESEPIALLCLYDRRRLSADVLREVLRTHRRVVVDGRLCRNPLFEPPAVVLGQATEDDRIEWMLGRLQVGRRARDLTEAERIEEELRRRSRDLGERVKELRCLYGVADVLREAGRDVDAALRGVVEHIPPGWQFPEFTEARLEFDERVVETEGFTDSGPSLEAEAAVDEDASVRLIVRIRDAAAVEGDPFIPEESELAEAVVDRVAETLRRRRAERELRRSGAKFRALIEQGSDLIAILSEDATLQYHSPTTEQILGYPPGELVGERIFDYVHPEDHGEVREALSRRVEDTATRTPGVFRFRQRDGEWCHLEAFGTNLLDDPDVRGLVVNARDVTERIESERERNRLEAELRQAQKMEAIGRLAGGIAHDFNNLLTVIRGHCDLLLDDDALDPGSREDIEQIRDAGDRAATLTQQLLAFGRKQVLDPRVLDLNAVVDELEAFLGRLIGEDIRVVTELDPELPPVEADPGQIEQAIVNVAVNARDAMPGGGELIIRTGSVRPRELSELSLSQPRLPGMPEGESREAERYVMVAVEDTGEGMSEEVRERAFEPFFSTKEEGSGLGLSTVYGIVRQSGGRVAVESRPGEGTTVRLLFPRSGDGLEPEETTSEATSSEPSGTVLLVEDEDGVRSLARRVLSREGYEVIVAADGEEGLRRAESDDRPIDLVVTDVVMPRLGGNELVERIRENRPEVAVLFISGYSDDAVARRGLLDPGIHLLSKPFSPDELLREVRRVLSGEP